MGLAERDGKKHMSVMVFQQNLPEVAVMFGGGTDR
jgi:hypothetical protein